MPGSAGLNYFFQKHITRNLPVSDELFEAKIEDVLIHFKHFKQLNPNIPAHEIAAYEFGAGWDMIGPITYFNLGIDQQKLIDLKSHLRFDLIHDALQRFPKIAGKLNLDYRATEFGGVFSQNDLAGFGLQYSAPMDASCTEFTDQSFDLITSTNTFEHIPVEQIPGILKECKRLLKPNGVMCFRIDYQDHYAYFDPSISVYNFMQFSEIDWRPYNHSVQFQNRLRHSEYLQFFRNAGLNVAIEKKYRPTKEDQLVLMNMDLARHFQRFDESDLLTRWCYFAVTG